MPPCHFQSNRGRGAPSLPPSPALTLALTGLLGENWVLGGGGVVSVSSNLLILLLHLRAAVCCLTLCPFHGLQAPATWG